MQEKKPPTIWRPEHLQELDEMFPEQARPGSADELNYRAGQRAVVQYLRDILSRYTR